MRALRHIFTAASSKFNSGGGCYRLLFLVPPAHHNRRYFLGDFPSKNCEPHHDVIGVDNYHSSVEISSPSLLIKQWCESGSKKCCGTGQIGSCTTTASSRMAHHQQLQQHERPKGSSSSATEFLGEHAEGLILYHDRFSYYSQKVVLALHEKNLQFQSKLVNLFNGDQYKFWFLQLNPKGEVPVLQDTGKIIPDSARIIDYLEDNLSNGDTPRLIPMDQGPEIRQKVNHFRHLLQNVPEGLLTTGAVLNPRFMKNPKTPFIAPVRKALANAEKDMPEKLRSLAEKNPDASEDLLKKAAKREESYKSMCDENNFQAVLHSIEVVLTEIEEELAKHALEQRDWWLCSDRFTAADVELTILLERISQLGLEHVFWSAGKRPHLERYYQRVRQRDSYKRTIPGSLFLWKTILISKAPLVIGVVAAVALLVSGVLIARKYIS